MDAETLNYILMALLAVEQVLAQSKTIQSNSMFQLASAILKFVVRK